MTRNCARVSDPDPFTGSRVTVRIRPDNVLNADFLGFGCHGDNLLPLDINTSRGVTSADQQLIRTRVAAMRPKIVRLLFDYKWWEPVPGQQGVDNPFLAAMVDWIRFLQSIHCDVIIHPWGDCFAYSDWMNPPADPTWWTNAASRLPIPSQRDAMVRSLADFLHYLRHDQQLTNVRYVALMNEPDNDFRRPTPADEFIRLNRLLSRSLKDRELGREVLLLGPDDSSGQSSGKSLWWSQTVPQAIDVFDGFSSHTYKHRDTRMLEKWIGERLEDSRRLDPAGPQRPLLVTEFGYVGLTGETFDNPENTAYEYGLFMGDFAIAILNSCAFGRPHLVPVRSVLRHNALPALRTVGIQRPRLAAATCLLFLVDDQPLHSCPQPGRGGRCDTGVRELAGGCSRLARWTTDHHASQPLQPRIAGHAAYRATATCDSAGVSLHSGRVSHGQRSDVQRVERVAR